MPAFALLQAVRLTEDLPDYGLAAGATGAVVEIFEQPEGYSVEFVSKDGDSVLVDWLAPEQLAPVTQ